MCVCSVVSDSLRPHGLSMGFSRQGHWSGLPFPPLGDLPDSGIEPASPALGGRFFTTEPPGKPLVLFTFCLMGTGEGRRRERKKGIGFV